MSSWYEGAGQQHEEGQSSFCLINRETQAIRKGLTNQEGSDKTIHLALVQGGIRTGDNKGERQWMKPLNQPDPKKVTT